MAWSPTSPTAVDVGNFGLPDGDRADLPTCPPQRERQLNWKLTQKLGSFRSIVCGSGPLGIGFD
jgi:hypothetical protein